MNILYNYDGASIDVIKNDIENNTVDLSLKKENGKFSHYYNFIVENNEEKIGIIHLKNMQNSAYYSEGIENPPYIKIKEWERLKEFEISQNGDLIIKIEPNTTQEISLLPRYTQEDLKKFIQENQNDKLKIKYEPINEIIIGDTNLPAIVFTARQHPGETLSSFFIEGVIEKILDSELLDKYCFIIYPLVNIKGVKNGNHRYTNGIDYNRSWNKKDAPKEIEYIKDDLKRYKIKYFIDVHNDEITKQTYIRTPSKRVKIKSIAGIDVMLSQSKIRRFARALIKQRKIINVFSQTAIEYVFKKYNCDTFLIEISMRQNYKDINKLAKKFIDELLGV